MSATAGARAAPGRGGSLQVHAGTLDAGTRERVFDGELLVFRGLRAQHLLRAHALRHLRAAFAPWDPEEAERRMTPARFVACSEQLRRSFGRDPHTRVLYLRLFGELGLAPGEVYCDRLRLRVVPRRRAHQTPLQRPLPPHRDTWASGLAAQINLWAPLSGVDARNTLLLYPAYWRSPVRNDSAQWDVEALRRARRGAAQHAYPWLPSARQELAGAGLPVLLAPGELLCFSGAHLHASVAQPRGATRFGLETRIVCASDLRSARGAPLVDAAPSRAGAQWFRRCSDGAPLTAAG